jgi:hypothetical protein
LPPAALAVHPFKKNGVHEHYLICDNVEAFVAEINDDYGGQATREAHNQEARQATRKPFTEAERGNSRPFLHFEASKAWSKNPRRFEC